MLKGMVLHDAGIRLDAINQVYDSGYDLTEFVSEMLELLRNATLVVLSKESFKFVDIPEDELKELESLATKTTSDVFTRSFQVMLDVHEQVSRSPRPKLILEMAVAKLISIRPAHSIDDLVSKITKCKVVVHPVKGLAQQHGLPTLMMTHKPVHLPLVLDFYPNTSNPKKTQQPNPRVRTLDFYRKQTTNAISERRAQNYRLRHRLKVSGNVLHSSPGKMLHPPTIACADIGIETHNRRSKRCLLDVRPPHSNTRESRTHCHRTNRLCRSRRFPRPVCHTKRVQHQTDDKDSG